MVNKIEKKKIQETIKTVMNTIKSKKEKRKFINFVLKKLGLKRGTISSINKAMSGKKTVDIQKEMEEYLQEFFLENNIRFMNNYIMIPDLDDSKKYINDITKVFETVLDINKKNPDNAFQNHWPKGTHSVNGIVLESGLRGANDTKIVIKTNANVNSDGLYYEYIIQKLCNEFREYCPNYSMSYGYFSCNPSVGVYKLLYDLIDPVRFERDRDSLPNVKTYGRDRLKVEMDKLGTKYNKYFNIDGKEYKAGGKNINKICRKTKDKDSRGFLVTEYFTDSETLYDHIKSKVRTFRHLFSLLMQVTAALYVGYRRGGFTHYDLHPDNILVKELNQVDSTRFKKGEEVLFIYGTHDKELPYILFNTEYLINIIDFGRAHHDKNKKLGWKDSNPKDKKFTRFSKQHHITPNQSMPAHDLIRIWSSSLAAAETDWMSPDCASKTQVLLEEIKRHFSVVRSTISNKSFLWDKEKEEMKEFTGVDFIKYLKGLDDMFRVFHGLSFIPPILKFDVKETQILLFNSNKHKNAMYKGTKNDKNGVRRYIIDYESTGRDLKKYIQEGIDLTRDSNGYIEEIKKEMGRKDFNKFKKRLKSIVSKINKK